VLRVGRDGYEDEQGKEELFTSRSRILKALSKGSDACSGSGAREDGTIHAVPPRGPSLPRPCRPPPPPPPSAGAMAHTRIAAA
jgi:hypothetical protein